MENQPKTHGHPMKNKEIQWDNKDIQWENKEAQWDNNCLEDDLNGVYMIYVFQLNWKTT